MTKDIMIQATAQPVIQNYFNLVKAVASKIKRRLPAHVDIEDLVQTGMIGLMEASSRYDATRMVEFSSYATTRITGAILDELRKWDTCSRQDRKAGRAIEKAKFNLRTASGEEPSSEQIAKAAGLGLAEYERTLRHLESGKQVLSHSDSADTEMEDDLSRIPSKDESAFEIYSKRQDSSLLKSYIDQLKPRQREVLNLYYFEELQLKAIGERLGVGEARISQIHKEAVTELRRMIDAQKRVPVPSVSAMVQ